MRWLALLLAVPGIAYAQPTNLMPFEWDVTLPTASTALMKAVPANPTRKGLLVCNTGTAVLTINFGTKTPTVTTGIVLAVPPAVNACLQLMPYMGTNVSMGAQINAISATANATFTALEF